MPIGLRKHPYLRQRMRDAAEMGDVFALNAIAKELGPPQYTTKGYAKTGLIVFEC
jgi:hypothetical protein